MARVAMLALFVSACAPAADGLSGHEELGILDGGPEEGGVSSGGDAGGDAELSGAGAASASGWIATATVVDDPDATVSAGTLSARASEGGVVCQHAELVAPCGTLSGEGGFAWDAAAGTGTFRYALTPEGTANLCRWTVSYVLQGVTGGGALDVSVDVSGEPLDGTATSVTLPPQAGR